MAFSLNSYPFAYRAKFAAPAWNEEWIEKPHRSPAEEAAMGEAERDALAASRNCWSDMPLVGYTTQYGLGCFEGLKALPQKDGGLAIFRLDRNAARFHNSMTGLLMPGFPEKLFVAACVEAVRKNAALGFRPAYKSEWEKDSFMSADSVYIRPFAYSEGGIGVAPSKEPFVVVITTPVSAYFSAGTTKATTTDRVRAMPHGTGWIKAASNYVISTLAKKEANDAGFMECVFLDGREGKYLEEGSSCNIFVRLKSGELVTPELGDTILPGITRSSVIELARDRGVKVTERKVALEEAMGEGAECFVTGTAAGVTPIESLTHKGKTAVFSGGKVGELTAALRDQLKGIQYGTVADTKGWMVRV
ncbi:MAG: branched-chain-amino-acid transaminase [Treponema sp. RIFOXYC1_FULL_61_9]|nr:MAG: branched-chain-amino-acid transaminase [Treponema sp. RIFOXYC1_FULL_61_9]